MIHTHDVSISTGIVRKVYVSWEEGEPEREWAALLLLDREAPGLAPRPLGREEEDGRPVVVMSEVPGRPLTDNVSPVQQRGLVEALRRLFAVNVEDGLAERANGPSVMRGQLIEWLTGSYDLARCEDEALVADCLTRAREWLATDGEIVETITDPVIAIGDGNPDNVLWDGERCRLIDFEEHGVSDLAYEVADIVEHASSRLERRLDTEAFLAEMQLDEAQQRRVEEYRRLMACLWLAILLPGNGGFDRNPPGSTEDQARHLLASLGQPS